jgi:hypothetical protein
LDFLPPLFVFQNHIYVGTHSVFSLMVFFLLVVKGVPQGSVLGPLLFSLFINNLCAMVISMYHVYADDFQTNAGDTVHNFARCVERKNADLRRILTGKTQAMFICRDESRLVHPLPVLRLDGEVIPYSRNVKNLGIIMDERFSWCDQAKVVHRIEQVVAF